MVCPKCSRDIDELSLYCMYCGKKIGCKSAVGRKSKSRANGTGTVYKRESGNWQAAKTVYRSGIRKVVTKGGFKTKKEALDYLSELSPTKKREQDITIADLYKALQPTLSKLSQKRQDCYKSAYKKMADVELCNISELEIADLQGIIDDIDGGFYSKRYVKDLLSKMYQYACADGKADRDLSSYIVLPPNCPEKEKTTFTPDEILTLWQAWASGEEFAGYILILLYCGMRTGELWSVRCDSVNFEKKVMYGGIKNNKGRYSPIFIIDKIEPVVRFFVEKGGNTLYNGYATAFYREWREFKQKIGLREELQPYSGRHCCATILAQAGLPEATIMAITRHTKYDTTLQYTHIDTDSILNAMNSAFKNV